MQFFCNPEIQQPRDEVQKRTDFKNYRNLVMLSQQP